MSDYPYMDEFEYIDYCISSSTGPSDPEDTVDREAILNSGNYEEIKALILEDNRIHPDDVKGDIECVSDQKLLYELACRGVAAAIEKITDQNLLYDYYNKEDYVYYKERAVRAMTDQDNLLTIAQSWNSLESAYIARRKLDAEHIQLFYQWERSIRTRISELKQMDQTEAAKCILTEENWKVREWIAGNIPLPPDVVEEFEKREKCKNVRRELLYSSKDPVTLRIMARLDDDIYIQRNAEEYAEYWREKNNLYD